MKRLTLFPFALVASLFGGAASAQQAVESPAPIRLSLADALSRARASSGRLTSLQAVTRAAAAGVRGAEALRRPELDVAASYSRNSNVPELVLTSPGSAPRTIFPNLPNNWRGHLGATLPLYTGGRVESQIDAANASERASGFDHRAAERDLVAETRIAYVSVLFARENARVLSVAIASYDAHLKDARSRFEMGVSPSHEVAAVSVERERAELGRLQSENAATIATANLLRLVGLPQGTSVELDPGPLASAGSRSAADSIDAPATVIESRPEVQGLRARIDAMEASVVQARSVKKPQAGLQAGFDYANPNPRVLPLSGDWKETWSVGVNVNWKVLDGGKAEAAAAQAQAQTDALRAQLLDLESRIRLEVASRRLEFDSAIAGRAVAQRGIEAARDALRVARDRYREGVMSSSELLDTETRLLRAELEATQVNASIEIAAANLDRAAGR